jgi:hypothetical protein
MMLSIVLTLNAAKRKTQAKESPGRNLPGLSNKKTYLNASEILLRSSS